jgi:hypothetical protein
VALGPTLSIWKTLAELVGAPLSTRGEFDPARIPLVAALRPLPADTGWSEIAEAVASERTGLMLALEHPDDADASAISADVVGVLVRRGERSSAIPVVGRALADALHPASRLSERRLRP